MILQGRFDYFEVMWHDCIRALQHAPAVSSRAGLTKEVLGACLRLNFTYNNWLWSERRSASPAYAAAELLWYLSGSDDASPLMLYAPQYKEFCDDGTHAHGAYGARWGQEQQIENALDLLARDPDSRQAVITCWKASDLRDAKNRASKDLPCTVSLQLLIRDGMLCMIATMRSNDVWLGMPYDVWCFTSLQKMLAAALEVAPGWYQHQAGSLHLYQKHWKAASECAPPLFVAPGRIDCVRPGRKAWLLDRAEAVELFDSMTRSGEEREVASVWLERNEILAESLALAGAHIGKAARPLWLDERLAT